MAAPRRYINGRLCELVELDGEEPVRPDYIPPLPTDLLARLVALPGKALAVYLVLHQLSTIKGRKTVALTAARLDKIGVNRWANYRSLDALERAGLIHVERRSGKNPVVTLLEWRSRS